MPNSTFWHKIKPFYTRSKGAYFFPRWQDSNSLTYSIRKIFVLIFPQRPGKKIWGKKFFFPTWLWVFYAMNEGSSHPIPFFSDNWLEKQIWSKNFFFPQNVCDLVMQKLKKMIEYYNSNYNAEKQKSLWKISFFFLAVGKKTNVFFRHREFFFFLHRENFLFFFVVGEKKYGIFTTHSILSWWRSSHREKKYAPSGQISYFFFFSRKIEKKTHCIHIETDKMLKTKKNWFTFKIKNDKSVDFTPLFLRTWNKASPSDCWIKWTCNLPPPQKKRAFFFGGGDVFLR